MCDCVEACDDDSELGSPQRFGRRLLLGGAAGAGLALLGAVPATARPYDDSALARAATSQNGWTVISSSKSSTLDRGFAVAGVGFPGGVRTGDASTILRYVATRFHAEVEPLRKGWCWGWSYRRIRGSGSQWSNHASATALDVNAPRHPLGKSGTFTAAQVRTIRAIVAACDGVIRWGGDYRGRKDEMHFEFNVGPGDPRVRALALRLAAGTPAPPVVSPVATSGWPVLEKGDRSFRVKVLQRLLTHHGHKVDATGYFGSKTQAAAKAFQRQRGLPVTGAVASMTWPLLAVTVKSGSSGQHVRAAQVALDRVDSRVAVDGKAGKRTVAAIKTVQRKAGLPVTGVLDRATWAALV